MNFQNENRNLIEEPSMHAFAYMLLGFLLFGIFIYRLGTAGEAEKKKFDASGINKVAVTQDGQTTE
jgi:hypothetical protein